MRKTTMNTRYTLNSPFSIGACAALVAALVACAPVSASAQSWPLDKPSLEALESLKSLKSLAAGFDDSWQERHGPEQTEKFSKTFKVGKAGSLELSNISGDITITAGPGDDIVINAVKRVHGSDAAQAKEQFGYVTIEAAERGSGRVEVRTNYQQGQHNIRVSVDYTVTVPTTCSVNVRSVSGDVKVSGVKGELRTESVSGDVIATDAGQLAQVKSISGDVDITSAVSTGDASISSISGDVTVKGLKAKGFDSSTISGELRLTDVACDRAMVKTISGDVQYSGPLTKSGRYEIKSHSGDIRLTMPEAVGFELDASTFSGSVKSDLPVTFKSLGSEEGRHTPRKSLKGTYGDGSVLLVLSSFSGDITIAKK
jgi:DUF4097 and DUF4098 domain-containing protein YvlB